MNYKNAQLNGVCPSSTSIKVLHALETAGLEAWFVGGWVRDALRARPCHDVDLCCSGTWQESKAALRAAGFDVVESGIRFGGITAVSAGERIEVTTYRVDGFYTDGRHPNNVRQASSVHEDLARRDFTVNAMAWHPARGLLDLYDGQGDLKRKLIRAVGEPQRRFEEDALRMLRAVRFACRLEFEIEAKTKAALAACSSLLSAIANERIGLEVGGILSSCRGEAALVDYPELICAAIPELLPLRGFDQRSPYHNSDVYIHTARVLGAASAHSTSSSLLWAALLHDIAKPQCFTLDANDRGHFYGHPEQGAKEARIILRRLGISEHLIREICLLIRWHDVPLSPTRKSLLVMMNRLSGEGLDTLRLMDELFDLKRADTLGKAPAYQSYVEDIEHMRLLSHKLMQAGEAYSLKTLNLNGGDLIAAGIKPGPQIGQLLQRALKATMQGRVANNRRQLLDFLQLG